MPQIPMPLSDESLIILRCNHDDYFHLINTMQDPDKQYVENATHRLAEIEWIIDKLQEEVNKHRPPIVQEGILSLQIYLLMTCADTLGHIFTQGGVRQRIREFFSHLSNDAKSLLIENLRVWKTDFNELLSVGIGNPQTNAMRFPTENEILTAVRNKTDDDRLSAVIEFLFCRRNLYTHEADYPQLGNHPNLSVLQNMEAYYPDVGRLGELDRIQIMFPQNDILIAYYLTNNVINTIFQTVLMGFGTIIGSL